MQLVLGSLTGLLNLIGYVPYIKDILKRKVKPHRITWGIWTILTTIAAFNQVANGGGYSSLFFISTAMLVGIVFVLSLRFGVGGASKIDRICLLLALLLLAYWITVQETRISMLLAVIIDAIGVIPTLIKTYKNPGTETYIQWTLAAVAGAFAILAVPRLDWALIIYPLHVILANGSIVSLKYLRERKSR